MAKAKPKYKCLKCGNLVKKNDNGRCTVYTCPMCGDMNSYYVKEITS